jgi:GNAT superfamily N-acetyltransferase
MLGGLQGAINHKEDHLRWRTGDVYYNYYCDTADVEKIVVRMKNNEIPKTLTFFTDSSETGLIEPFKATEQFKEAMRAAGMAHDLMDTVLPEPDKRVNLFRVRDTAQLKMAGSILNTVFEYRLFSYENYIKMMENDGQYFYIAEYDGLPVGACMAQHGDCFVNISWVGVLPGYRKLGIAGYLIQSAERDGVQQGKTIGVLHGFPEAVGVYRRIGYKEYCMTIVLELQ